MLQFEYDSIIGRMTVVNNNGVRCEMNVEKGSIEKYAVCIYMIDNVDSVELID